VGWKIAERFGQSGRVCEESENLGFSKSSGAAKQSEAGVETQLVHKSNESECCTLHLHALGIRLPGSLVEMSRHS